MIDRKTFFALLMVPLLCLGVFAQEEFSDEAEQTPIPEKVKQELTMLLPDMAALGAEPAGKIEFYGSNLFEYINGL